MNKIDWVFWSIIAILVAMFIITICSCAILQSKPAPTINLTPAAQMWQAAKEARSSWLVTLAIPIIALGAVAIFNGAGKLGVSAVIFGCVTLFMALATARFALWMSIFGLIGSVTAVAASILSRKQALVEIIKGVQMFKINESDSNSVRHLKGKLSKQTKSTKKIIQDIKTNLKLKGEI